MDAPTVALPCGFTDDGRSVGLQLAGSTREEVKRLRVADDYQRATDWHTHRPL